MMKRLFLLCMALAVAATVVVGAPANESVPRAITPRDEDMRKIQALEGVTEVCSLAGGEFAGKYEAMLTQPLDWHNPDAGTFCQRVVVMHVGYNRPTVVITQGYDANFGLKAEYRDELSKLFDTNIILVEHRYFDRSKPEPLDWKYLTAENSAYDLHHVVNLFRKIYGGKWIASGISKGGTTTMLYAAYFPNDVDMYVPYVGPLGTAVEDKRFGPFLAQVSTPENRAAVEAFQTELFKRKERLLPGFSVFCEQKGYTFRLPVDQIFDYCVLEYRIAFWQWGRNPKDIPALTASDQVLLDELVRNAGPDYFTQNSPIAPFFVQAARELGYYPYDLRPFRKYTSVRTTRNYLRRIFLPEELRRVTFSKKLYKKVSGYLKKNDPRMIMIYGGDDPWTAPGAAWTVTPDKRNMKVFVEPGGSHRTRIGTLPDDQREEAVRTLRGWLEN